MNKRKKKFGENIVNLINDPDIINVLEPINATKILKSILEFERNRINPTPSIISRKLNISPSTVVRNVERFNKIYLVETEEKGNSHLIELTEKGLKIAKIIENSETIELIEKNRTETISLINMNENLSKDLKSIIRVREIRVKELETIKKSIEKEIKSLSDKNDFDSKIKIKELQHRLLSLDQELYESQMFIEEKKNFHKKLNGETKTLQFKLDEFLPANKEMI